MSLPTTKDRHLKTLTNIPHRSTQFRVHVSFFGLKKKKKEKEKKMRGTGLTNLCFEACHILHVQYFCEINKLICSCFLDPAMYGATKKKTGKKG